MKREHIATALAAALAIVSTATAAPSQARQRSPAALTWLALGDSYSAGEGLRNNDIAANPPDRYSFDGTEFHKAQNCERATGTSTTLPASRTWSVVARDQLANLNFASFSLKACTGAITNEWRKQWEEAGGTKWDLVTLSMGGNNIGFASALMECAGISVDGAIDASVGGKIGGLSGAVALWAFNPALGCNVTEDELRHRVDQLVGKDINAPRTAFDNSQTLPDMYREIAEIAVSPGGHVIVVGYPNLIEDSGQWTWGLLSGNRCHRIRRADANMFRRVLGYLNQQIAIAAIAANDNPVGVHFEWIDVSKVYENDSSGHHGLCTGQPWLNGVTFGADGPDAGLLGIRIFRSFHPNQLGYDHTGSKVAEIIAGLDWAELAARAPVELSSCEGVAISLVESPILPVSSCTTEGALVRWQDCCPNGNYELNVALIRDQEIIANWSRVDQGPDISGYSVDSITAAGIPRNHAQTLFDATGGPCAIGGRCLDDEMWASAVAFQETVRTAATNGDAATLAALYLPGLPEYMQLPAEMFANIDPISEFFCTRQYFFEQQRPAPPAPGWNTVRFSLQCDITPSSIYFGYLIQDGVWRISFVNVGQGD